jgi:hypothetical protein
LLKPGWFWADLEMIERAGRTNGWTGLTRELADFGYSLRMHGGVFRRVFRMRVSGRRLMSLAERLFGTIPA